MAFTRKFSKTRRKFSRRRGTPLAHVRRTWECPFNRSVCDPLTFPLSAEGCRTLFKLVLLDNATLQSKFSDRGKVVRILGDMWFQLDNRIGNAVSGGEIYGRMAASAYQMFYGLRVGDQDHDDQTLSPDPLGFDEDLSESRWLKTWQVYRNAFDQFNLSLPVSDQGQPPTTTTPVMCIDVHTTGLPANSFVDGTGDITIETDCNTPDCVQCEQPALSGYVVELHAMPTYHVHFDVKKRISLRENQELYLMCDLACPGSAIFTDFEGVWTGNLRTLVEM